MKRNWKNILKLIDKKADQMIANGIIALCSVGMFVMVMAIIFEVITRYVFGISHGLIGENCKLIFVWIVFMSVCAIFREDGHISRSLLEEIFAEGRHLKAKLFLNIFHYIMALVFGIMFAYFGISDTLSVKGGGARSFFSYVPPDWIYNLALPVGSFLLIYYAIRRIIKAIYVLSDFKSNGESLRC